MYYTVLKNVKVIQTFLHHPQTVHFLSGPPACYTNILPSNCKPSKVSLSVPLALHMCSVPHCLMSGLVPGGEAPPPHLRTE